MKLLVTGGCGFIGSNFIRHMLRRDPDCAVVNLDALTYAGNEGNLQDLRGDARYRFVKGDICDRDLVEEVAAGVDAIVHLAAESHVDRSIQCPAAFVRTNVMGTQTLLDVARDRRIARFLHVSTDEVYGSLGPEGRFREEAPLAPNSPYAASKAAADLLVRAAVRTHGLPALITRACNTYGPYQFPEKLIPLLITNALQGEPLPLYGDGRHVREWLHVEDHCAALEAVLRRGQPGEIYNIGSGQEASNRAVAHMILGLLAVSCAAIRHVPDRPGHDRRYALDAGKIAAELGWRAAVPLAEGLARTAAWYRAHQAWWRPLKVAGPQASPQAQPGPASAAAGEARA